MSRPSPTKVPLASLKPHPWQEKVFGAPEEKLVEVLAADIETNGLNEPITTLPDGTILAGHGRVAAARRLGWTEIDAYVRHDLADDPIAAARLFADDNANRRHLSLLRRVSAEVAVIDAEHAANCEAEYGDRSPRPIDERWVAEIVVQKLGGSPKNIARYVAVSRASAVIGAALEAGRLPLALAARLARLAPKERQRIAKEIERRGIKEARAVADEYFGAGRHAEPAAPLRDYDAALAGVRELSAICDGSIDVPDRSRARLSEDGKQVARLAALLSAVGAAITKRLEGRD